MVDAALGNGLPGPPTDATERALGRPSAAAWDAEDDFFGGAVEEPAPVAVAGNVGG